MAASTVLLTGLAGLVAGALSMGAGEWISVRSQRELLTASAPGPGTHALVPHLDVDANELALVHRARGMPAEEAQQRADVVLERQKEIFEPPSFEALDAVGSERSAALSSFAFFAYGAAVPVLPYALGLSMGATLAVACALRRGRPARHRLDRRRSLRRAGPRSPGRCGSWRSVSVPRGSPMRSAVSPARRSARPSSAADRVETPRLLGPYGGRIASSARRWGAAPTLHNGRSRQ